MHVLYIVATPIGNLEDITLRALRTLREVSLIAAEDTRKTKRLLTKYGIKTPLTSYYEHNKLTKLDYILKHLEEGDIALVSEAGTPGINDPGYELVQEAIKHSARIVPIPGPSAVITALIVSGLPTDKFVYSGFLPNRAASRRKTLESMSEEPGTLIMLEAPHRITKSLQDIRAVLGNRLIAVCRELTKIHEEVFRGTVDEAIAHFLIPKGEFTIVIEGKQEHDKPQITDEVGQQLKTLHNNGMPIKDAIALLVKTTGIPRKKLYQKWLLMKDSIAESN